MPDPAFKCLRIVDKKLCSIFKKDFSLDKVNKSRHKYEKTYDADGIIDIYKTEVMLKKTLLGNRVLPFVTQDTYSNIDTLEQLKSVRSILKKTRKRS
jgi:CMP-N-acetylneuraminic acid synthetase